jgi:restriction endonuclease S subunit
MKISYPASLDKQKEIVEKLDKIFVEIDLLEKNFALLESLINECDASILGRPLNFNDQEQEGYRTSTLDGVTELI